MSVFYNGKEYLIKTLLFIVCSIFCFSSFSVRAELQQSVSSKLVSDRCANGVQVTIQRAAYRPLANIINLREINHVIYPLLKIIVNKATCSNSVMNTLFRRAQNLAARAGTNGRVIITDANGRPILDTAIGAATTCNDYLMGFVLADNVTNGNNYESTLLAKGWSCGEGVSSDFSFFNGDVREFALSRLIPYGSENSELHSLGTIRISVN